jgi:uncharacterized membrane protein
MRIQRYSLLLTLLLLGGASSCGFYREKSQPGVDLTQTDLTYANVNARIFSRQCIECHNSSAAEAGIVLDHYDSVKANLEDIEQEALIEQAMPPDGPLSSSDQTLLRAWIDAGAPLGQ